jgi:hypothetical protein
MGSSSFPIPIPDDRHKKKRRQCLRSHPRATPRPSLHLTLSVLGDSLSSSLAVIRSARAHLEAATSTMDGGANRCGVRRLAAACLREACMCLARY